MALYLNPYKNQSISMGKGRKNSKVTLAFWWQGVVKEIGIKICLQFTPVSYNISYLINRIHVGHFPLNDCSCNFVSSLVEN
jgi:hypothetical protein